MQDGHDCFSLLRLHRALGAEPLALAGLIRQFGDADGVFREATRSWLVESNFPPALIDSLLAPLDRKSGARIEADIEWLAKPGHGLVTLWDSDYPCLLAEIADPPPLIFVRGNAQVLGDTQIAMVGSRKMTATGRRIAMELAGDLARSGLTVTSGMALGIDSAAHRGALEAGRATIAVLACGCDRVYPPSHRRLAESIESSGALVSEFPLAAEPYAWRFPQRNRIVTGMSMGTIVVEAALKSGSLISARLAGEQGREVFAVPGSVYGSQSQGCHFLIKTGASLVDSAADVLEEFPGFEPPAADPLTQFPELEGVPGRIVDVLRRESATVDELAGTLSVAVTELLPALIELEIEGIVQATPLGYEMRIA